MNERGDLLSGLPERTFDEIYDETVKARPDLSPEKIEVLMNAKMRIRQGEIDKKKSDSVLRKRVKEIQPTQKLYEGWKAFRLLEHPADTHITEADFQEALEYLKLRKPSTLLLYLPIWETAEQFGAKNAYHLFEAEKKVMNKAVEEALKNTSNDEMMRFMEVMSKPD